MIDCSKLFGKRTLVNYQEFNLAMAMAVECGRRNTCLDMSMMRILDPEMLSTEDKLYLRYLRSVGEVYDGKEAAVSFKRNSIDDQAIMRPLQWFDPQELNGKTDLFSYDTENECYRWSSQWAMREDSSIVNSPIVMRSTLGKTLLHLVWHFLVSKYLGFYEDKPLVISLQDLEVRSTYIYLTVYTCTRSCEKIGREVSFDFSNMQQEVGSLLYLILYEQARNAGRFQYNNRSIKIEAARKMGWAKGKTFVLYTKAKMSANNPAGYIKEAVIIIANGDIHDGDTVISFTKFGVNKTLEEKECDYAAIDEEYKYLFTDMMRVQMHISQGTLDLNDVGFLDYFYYEEYLIEPIDRFCTVRKKVTIDGVLRDMEFNTVDAVYWIMNEYKVMKKSEKELYRRQYNNGQPLLWDSCDGTPLLLTVQLKKPNRDMDE